MYKKIINEISKELKIGNIININVKFYNLLQTHRHLVNNAYLKKTVFWFSINLLKNSKNVCIKKIT